MNVDNNNLLSPLQVFLSQKYYKTLVQGYLGQCTKVTSVYTYEIDTLQDL